MPRAPQSEFAGRTLAVVRIATGAIFLLFGEYKIAGPDFAQRGFAVWIRGFLAQNEPVGFYRVFLEKFVLVHPALCARMVGWGELAIGVSLVLGLCVRAASVAGAIHMLSLALARWYAPGHGAPLWQYFGASLDHIPLLFLFAIFFAARAGDVWGLDGLLAARAMRRIHPATK
jgi:uncharacterized membrane protein YphA (DoxX/SURF4 family)